MNIRDINVGDILVWTSPSGTYNDVVMVIEKDYVGYPLIKVKIVSSSRQHRIGKMKIFNQETLNHRRTLEPLA